ncbi:MAG: toxin-antitoxin system, toxin component, PIN family protein [Dehalococcoidia bacterium]|nr:toxin-antitoxin system, toxin component, PIN family protein [Dehalococcoidia bacterium]MYA52055.1 toxin-antitoxin system, toxin component, PIN family protein [Dehalococcoidia bacterium]
MALAEQRILITEDKDFGELVFVRRLPHPCIIRFTDMPIGEKVAAMLDLVEQHQEEMREGSMIVVTRNRVRIRRGEG